MFLNDTTLNSTTLEDLGRDVAERFVGRQTHLRPSRQQGVEPRATLLCSSWATQRNARQVLPILDMIDNQPQLYTPFCGKLPRRAASEGAAEQEPSARFEARSVARGSQAIEDFARRAPVEPLVRPMLVEPNDVVFNLRHHCLETEGHHDSSKRFALERADAALSDRDAAVPADGAKARLNAAGLTPSAIVFSKLHALVADHVLWRRINALHASVQHCAQPVGGRLLSEDLKAEDFSREVIHDEPDVPPKGQACGNANGNHGTQKPRAVGIVVKSTFQ